MKKICAILMLVIFIFSFNHVVFAGISESEDALCVRLVVV